MLRIDFLDSFVAFEVAINRWLFKISENAEHGKQSVGQRIDRLKSADLTSFAKAGQIGRMTTIFIEVERLLDLRNAVAHGVARIGMVDETSALLLQNSADVALNRPNYYVISVNDLTEASAKLKRFAGEMTNWLTQPAPPQPRPAAATGP